MSLMDQSYGPLTAALSPDTLSYDIAAAGSFWAADFPHANHHGAQAACTLVYQWQRCVMDQEGRFRGVFRWGRGRKHIKGNGMDLVGSNFHQDPYPFSQSILSFSSLQTYACYVRRVGPNRLIDDQEDDPEVDKYIYFCLVFWSLSTLSMQCAIHWCGCML